MTSFFNRLKERGAAAPSPPVDIGADARAIRTRAAMHRSAPVRPAAVQAYAEAQFQTLDDRVTLPIATIQRPEQPPGQMGAEATDIELLRIRETSGRIVSADKEHPLFCDAEQRKILAIFENGTFVVAKAHRTSIIVSDMINRARNAHVQIPRILTADFAAIKNLYGADDRAIIDSVEMTKVQANLFDQIKDAARSRASDIHIKTEGGSATIAYTIKGDFIPICDIDRESANRLMIAAFNACESGDKNFNPLKSRMARLDTSDKFVLPSGVQALRLNFSPIADNNLEMVARLLYHDAETNLQDIDSLGYERAQIDALNIMRRQAYGIILISGPTGSGKSTTLKVALERTWADRKGKSKIVTIEDPPEYVIKGASQMPVESGSTLEEKAEAFTRAMSSMLRMAPNIGMVGEMRESNAAKLTFDMAKTGHLVWTSVHANTALDTIIRVRDMGVSSLDLEDAYLMRGLIAQRLVKSLCPHCARPFIELARNKPARDSYNASGALPIYDWMIDYYMNLGAAMTQRIRVPNVDGCSQCKDDNGRSTGHAGRRVVAETIIPTRPILKAVVSGDLDRARHEWLNDTSNNANSTTMLEHGLVRVLRGEISPTDLAYVGDVALEIPKDRIEKILSTFATRT